MLKLIAQIFAESIAVKQRFAQDNADLMVSVAETMVYCLRGGNKILLFGNGGSAADAQHIAAEFVNRFKIERPPLAALALTTDTSILTSIGNDYDFNNIFSKQLLAFGKQGDIAIGISTSGNSPNVIEALRVARDKDIYTIGFTGKGGGKMKDLCKALFAVDSTVTARIQETHITIAHALCELVERLLYPTP
ncbi:MAG: D-sedoheptulose 7-phosphate isomerase [Pseudomonadota bacterium]